MQFLETRSEVKVTVTQLWYATLPHLKRHQHTTFEIPTSNNIRDMLLTRLFQKLGQVTVTRKWCATLRHPKMHPHIKFGLPTSTNIGDMHRTRSGTDGQTDIVITIKTKSEVKVTVTRKWYTTLRHPKMHPHAKF